MEETTVTEQPSLYNHAIKHGVILGGITLALVIVIYATEVSFLATFKFIGLVLLIGIGFIIYAGINYRNSAGGYLSYGKAFIHGGITLLVSGIIGIIFNIVLYHVIDPDLPQTLTDAVIQNVEEMMTNFGAQEDQIEKTVEQMRNDIPKQFTIGGLTYQFVKNFFWYAILAAITSFIVKKNQPEEI